MSLATRFNQFLAQGSAIVTVAIALGCTGGAATALFCAGLAGLNVAAALTEKKKGQSENARDEELLGALRTLIADAQAGKATAFLTTDRAERIKAAFAIAKREGIPIGHHPFPDAGLPIYVADAVARKRHAELQTSTDAAAAQLGEVWAALTEIPEFKRALAAVLRKLNQIERTTSDTNRRVRKGNRTNKDTNRRVKKIEDAVIPKNPANPPPSPADRARYRKLCEFLHGAANLEALFRDGRTIRRGSITIGDLFVEPHLLVESTAPYPAREDRTPPSPDPQDDPSDADRIDKRHAKAQTERSPAFAICDKHPHLLILGDPGSGKTTLLQFHLLTLVKKWEADPAINPFPVLIRLAHWEKEGQGARFADFVAPYLASLGPEGEELTPNPAHIAQWMSGGRILLLDGIDEIRDIGKRQLALTRLSGIEPSLFTTRYIITSRPSGYARGSLGIAPAETEIAPLDDAQALQHLKNYEAVFKKFGDPPRDLQGLLPKILERPGLASVARNALFLHLIVFFERQYERLPHDRLEFYKDATEILATKWIAHRTKPGATGSVAASTPSGPFLTRLLCYIAHDMMCRGIVALSAEDLDKTVCTRLAASGIDELAIEREKCLFIEAARDLVGVIVDKGGDKFGFLHLSFQEYYCARWLETAQKPAVANTIARHWDDQDWAEVWLLYLSAIDGDVERVQHLHDTAQAHKHPTLDDKLLRIHLTRLRWSGYAGRSRCTAEEKSIAWAAKRITEWDEQGYGTEICAILAKWERGLDAPLRTALANAMENGSYWVARHSAIGALTSHPEDCRDFPRKFLAALRNQDYYVRSAAARAVGIIAKSDAAVRKILLGRLVDGKGEGVERNSLVFALSELAGSDAEVRKALLGRLVDGYGEIQEREALPSALGHLAGSDAEVRKVLLARFEEENAGFLERGALARALGELVGANVEVRKALLARFVGGNGGLHERRALVRALGGLAGTDAEVRKTLLGRFVGGKGSSYEREALTHALGGLPMGHIEVHKELLGRFVDGYGEGDEREALARVLSGLAGSDAEVRKALIGRFVDGNVNWQERGALASGIGGLARRDEAVRKVLLRRFMGGEENHYERAAIAHALGGLLGSDAQVRKALLGRFVGGKGEGNERRNLARVLGGLAASDAEVRKALLGRLVDGKGEEFEREALAHALAPVAVKDADVRKAVISAMESGRIAAQMFTTMTFWRALRVDRLAREGGSPAKGVKGRTGAGMEARHPAKRAAGRKGGAKQPG